MKRIRDRSARESGKPPQSSNLFVCQDRIARMFWTASRVRGAAWHQANFCRHRVEPCCGVKMSGNGLNSRVNRTMCWVANGSQLRELQHCNVGCNVGSSSLPYGRSLQIRPRPVALDRTIQVNSEARTNPTPNRLPSPVDCQPHLESARR